MMNETLKRIGTSKGWSDEETMSKFAHFVEESFPEVWTQNGNKLDGLDADDLDFFSASFDVSMNRRSGGGGGKGEEWVGMIVAYNGRRDTMLKVLKATLHSPCDMESSIMATLSA